jgi:hypothetical protein
MAYDLVLRRQLDRDYSRGAGRAGQAGTRLAGVAALGLLLSTLAAPRSGKKLERRYYRRAYRGDLRATQETPVVTMRELVYGPR